MKQLKKKYFRILLFTAASLLILFTLALGIFYTAALKKDYNGKASAFSRQQLAGIERRFKQFDRMAESFYDTLPPLSGTVSKASILYEMTRLTGKSLSITSIFFVEPDLSYVAVPSYIYLSFPESVIGQHPELFTKGVTGSRWYMLSNETDSDDTSYLLYLSSVEGIDTGSTFTLCCLTKTADMLPVSDTPEQEDRLFAGRNYATALSCSEEGLLALDLTRYPLIPSPKKTEQETESSAENETAAEQKKTAAITSPDYIYQLSGTPFSLSVSLISKPFRQMLLFLILSLAFLCTLLILFGALVLNRYLNRVTKALDDLSRKFSLTNSTADVPDVPAENR